MNRLKAWLSGRNTTILADQIVASASNALAVIAAGWLLDLHNINVYSLWQLAVTVLMAFQRAVLCEPSLALSDAEARADHTAGYCVKLLLPLAVIASAVVGFDTGSALDAVCLATGTFALVQDLLRYRAFGLHRPKAALISDSVFLGVMVILVIVIRPSTGPVMFLCWAASAALACLPLLVRADDRAPVPFREVLALGKYQVADWAIVVVSGALPMFLIAKVVPLSSLGAFRFAQTLTGPLNTISSFVTVRFLVDADSFRSGTEAQLRRRIRRSVLMMVGVNLLYGVVAFTGWFIFRGVFKPELTTLLLYALPLTLMSSVLTAPAAIYTAMAKATRMQRFAIEPRLVTMFGALVAMGLGILAYWHYRVDPLVIVTIMVPVVTTLSWMRAQSKIMRALRAEGVWDDPSSPLAARAE